MPDDHVLKLPDQPSLEQLRKQAKDLRRAEGIGLSAAQLAVARRYGFASWTRLKKHVEFVTRYSRFPDRITADADPAEEFLRLACLTYADDQPSRWDEARRLLDLDRGIVAGNVYVAAATGDAGELRRVLAADPGAARREGGPYRWEPLFYLAYARHDPEVSLDAVLGSARLLLDAGADPNAGYLWHGLPTPFTVLTGVFGEGELGPIRQPRHPHSIALARLLLEAGADPNDGQALYNRMFEPGNDHLELLLEFGLGTGDGGPWRRRLGDALAAPAAMVRGELAWAITHGLADRVRLLVGHGVDLAAPFDDGVTVTSAAATTGHPELIGYLVEHGAPAPDLTPPDAFVAAALAADRARMGLLLADHPALAGQTAGGTSRADHLGGRVRVPRRGRVPGRAGLRRERQGADRRAERPALADGAAQGGRGREPRAGAHAAAARRGSGYPRPPIQLDAAGLGPLLRPARR